MAEKRTTLYIEQPIADMFCVDGQSEEISYSSCIMQGFRTNLELFTSCKTDFMPGISLFAIYDGHGGTAISEYCREQMPEFIKKNWNPDNIAGSLKSAFMQFDASLKDETVAKELRLKKKLFEASRSKVAVEVIQESEAVDVEVVDEIRNESDSDVEIIYESFKENNSAKEEDDTKKSVTAVAETEVENISDVHDEESDEENLEEIIDMVGTSSEVTEAEQSAELSENKTEADPDDEAAVVKSLNPEEVSEENESESDDDSYNPSYTSGTCALVTLLVNNETIYVASVGDSRCLVYDRKRAIEMTQDNEPDNLREYARIKKAGGFVENERVNGVLAVSRSLGDHFFKRDTNVPPGEQIISPEPSVETFKLTPETEFILLATSGIWKHLECWEAATFVSDMMSTNPARKWSSVCEALFKKAMASDMLEDSAADDSFASIIFGYRPQDVHHDEKENLEPFKKKMKF